MNYEVVHYWSDENTFATEISREQYTDTTIDAIIEDIKQHQTDEVANMIEDLGTDPVNIGLDILYDEKTDSDLTIHEFQTMYPEIDDLSEIPTTFYGWEINKL